VWKAGTCNTGKHNGCSLANVEQALLAFIVDFFRFGR